MVLCPLTIIDNWDNEIKRFSPKLKTLKYVGDQEQRENLKRKTMEFIYANNKDPKAKDPKLNFNIFLTTYEIIMKGTSYLIILSDTFLKI